MEQLFAGGYEFETPIPLITPEGVKPFPPTGYRTLDAADELLLRHHRDHTRDGDAPARHRLDHLYAQVDADKNYFDGAKTYKVTLPKDIPAANFWSLTVYDNQTGSMLDTPQRYPRAGSQSFPRRRRTECRRHHDGLLRPDPARGRRAR